MHYTSPQTYEVFGQRVFKQSEIQLWRFSGRLRCGPCAIRNSVFKNEVEMCTYTKRQGRFDTFGTSCKTQEGCKKKRSTSRDREEK